MQDLLHRAMHADRLSLFVMLIEMKECNINRVNNDGQTALHIACTSKNMKYTQALTQQPTCDLNIQDDNGDTALHIAACSEWNSAEKIQCILECDRCDPNITNEQGHTPLHLATVNRQFDSIKNILNYTKCDPNIQDFHGNTALHFSTLQKSATGIEYFLMCDKVDFNIQNRKGNTPLHEAAISKAIHIFELIKHPHCNPSIANHDGMTPLQIASITGQLFAAEKLVSCMMCSHEETTKAIQDLLLYAMHTDRMALFNMLIQMNECNINKIDNDGQTALHIACTSKNMNYIQALTQQPTCDLNIQDDNGDTALHIAACSEWNSAEKIQCILDSGRCDPNITNKEGYTPLLLAITKSKFKSVEMLLKCTKCNPNIQDTSGNTALHLFIDRMFINIEPFIRCANTDINIQNREGNTPLHIAMIREVPNRIVEMLLHYHHCNVGIANNESKTPLQIAVRNGRLNVVNMMVQNCSQEDIAKAVQCSACLLHCTISANISVLFFIIIHMKEFINEVNHDGQTALHITCAGKNMKYIQALTQQATCDLNIQYDNGDTALHIAACSAWNSAEKIQCILDSGRCDPNITNKHRFSPLHRATANNQFDSVQMLLNSTRCNPNIPDLHGNTALHLSMHQKSVACVKPFLMCDKVDVNIQNKTGNTPLHVAVIEEAPPHIIRAIVHHEHCNVSIANNEGMTPLQISLNTKRTAVANIIVSKCSCEDRKKAAIEVTSDVLYKAVFKNCMTLVQALLDFQSEKVHLNLGFNETALHVACKKGYCDMIEILLEKGADVQAVNNDKYTPIHIVCRSLRCDCLKVLLGNKKSDLNQQNADGDTALHIVCKMVNTETIEHLDIILIKILLENGADVQAVNKKGDTPIHIACNGLRLDCLKAILQTKECDPNQKNTDGDTALHIVCKMVNIDTVHFCKIEILLENGADVQAVDSNGEAPIHIACNGLRLDSLKALLQSRGCDPNQQNADGDTALHIVCKMGENLDSNMRFIQALISTPGIDPEISTHVGLTPVEVAGTKYFVIQTLTNFLKHRQSYYQTYLKIFFVGNSGTGKSTLIKAITTEASLLRKYALFPKFKHVNPSNVPPHTAGIVPIPFNSKHFGHAVLYDFAGQHEYYSSHAAVMENLILPTPPLFLLLIDISKPIEKIKEELVFWWQFINNHSQRAAAPPHVMFVGSHKDKVRVKGDLQSIMENILKESVRDIQVSFKFEGFFPIELQRAGLSRTRSATHSTECNLSSSETNF